MRTKAAASPDRSAAALHGFRPRRSCPRLYRQTGLPPRRPTAGEGARFFPPRLSEFPRHTGARRFVRSSAVGDEPRLLFETEFAGAFGLMIGRHPHSPFHLSVFPFKAAFGSHVEDSNRLASLPQASQLFN